MSNVNLTRMAAASHLAVPKPAETHRNLNLLPAMKNYLPSIFRQPSQILGALATGLVLLATSPQAGAASATWLAAPFNNNWIAAPTTNNWSTGAGTFPGNTAGSGTADVATFSAASSITTINCASGFAIGGITFDTASASAYTINTSGGTWRLNTGNATIRVTGSVVNKQTITGSLRLQSSGTLFVISDSATPSATLNITTGISVNNSGSAGTLYLGGTNTGLNILGAFTEQSFTTQPGTLVKTNSGTWVLTGNNTHHNPTLIVGGTLALIGNGAIPNSPVITVNNATLSVSNLLTTANYLIATNSAKLLLTNTFFRTPLTVGTLTASNVNFRLGVNGSTPFTNVVVTSSLDAGPGIAFNIEQVANLVAATTFNLMSYAGTDPDPANFSVTVPATYTAGAVTVDTANQLVSVLITPPAAATSLVWVGATNSVLAGNWDTTTKNWVDAGTLSIAQPYADPDAVLFNDTASTNKVSLIGAFAPFGVTVNNTSLNYTFDGPGKITGAFGLTKTGNATLTLSETGGDNFAGGVSVTGGTLILDNTNSAITGGLTVGSGATVQIGKNNANGSLPAGSVSVDGALVFSRSNNFTLATSISGAGTLTQNGNGVLTLSTAHTYAGNTVVGKGTLALSGAGAISNSPSLIISNATLDVSAISARSTALNDFSIVTNTTLVVGPTNLQPAITMNTFEVDGIIAKSNVINVLALPPMASYPSTITLIRSANPITLAGGNFNFALGSLPVGAPAYVGSLSESGDNTAILLTLTSGPVGVRPSVTWNGTNNVSLTTNWSDAVNWQLPGTPVTTDNVIFGNNGVGSDAFTPNNVVDGNYTVNSLTYNQNGSGAYHVTDIPAGRTLAVSGTVTVGGLPAADNTFTKTYLTGGGTFVANGTVFNVMNFGNASSGSLATLDLSGLSNFVYNSTSGALSVGGNGANRSAGAMNLAGASNSITAGTLNLAIHNGANAASSNMRLGSGTNILNVGTINLVNNKNSGTLSFLTADGGLRVRGVGGTDADRANFTIANRNQTGTGTTTGTLNANGHPVDIKAGTMTIGQNSTSSSVNTGAGVVQFDTGTLDAITINLAVCSNPGAGAAANGTLTIGSAATLVVGSGGLSLVNQTAGASTGNVNLNGGTMICSNSIFKSTAAGTANLTLTDGMLNMVAGTIGTVATPIDNVNLSDNGNNDTVLKLNVNAGVPSLAATAVNIQSGSTRIDINSIVGVTGTTQIPLISYNNGNSPFAGLVLGSIPAGYSGASLVDNTANQTIDLLVTPPAPVVWKGAVGSVLNSTWNTSTLNWLNGATPVTYSDIDFVQFDDRASNNIVTLAATVSPAGINVSNNVLNYTFNGSGKISGAVGLTKQGAGTLILGNSGSNDFSGLVNLIGGTLQIGNNDTGGNLPVVNIIDNGALVFNRTDSNTVANLISGSGSLTQNGSGTNKLTAVNSYGGPTLISSGTLIVANAGAGTGNSSLGAIPGGAVTITNGGTLDVGGNTVAQTLGFTNAAGEAKQFFIAGAGAGGNGVIVNNGPVNQQNAFQYITLTANATVGGPGRWDMRGNGLITPVLDMGGFTLTKNGSNQMSMVNLAVTNGGSIVINSGIFSFETTSSNATTAIIVNAGGVLGHFREQAGFFTAPITLNGGMIRDLNGTPGSTNDSPITLTANSFLDLNVGSTDLLRLNGVIAESAGSFGLTKTNIGAFSLAATNTYSGPTVVVQGRLMLVDNGSIANSRTLSVAAGATLDAGQRVDGTLALNAGQTLSGFGTVTGIVTTAGSSIIAPGSATSTGTLTVSGNITLNGTNLMKLSPSSTTNDALATGGIITYGGTLSLTNISGTLTSASTFKLFSAAPGNYAGSFSAIIPAIPAPGLAWNTNTLTTDGILRFVATVNPNPTNLTATVSGNTLTLSWPADHTGWTLQVQTNSLSTGLNTNWFNVPGSTLVNTNVVPINPANGTVFYRMVLQ